MAEIIEGNATHIPVIVEIAEITWAATYGTILTPEEMRYMLDTIYAADTLLRVMRDGSQKFLLIKEKIGYAGFASYGKRQDEPGVFKLHKIYVLPNNQGKGLWKATDRFRKTTACLSKRNCPGLKCKPLQPSARLL